MSFEIPAPGVIPDFEDLETLARRRQTDLTDYLDTKVREYQGDICAGEGLSDSSERYNAHLADMLTYKQPDAKRQAQKEFVHTSTRFGMVIGQHLISPNRLNLSVERLLERSQDLSAFVHYVIDGPVDYLAERITLFSLLDRYNASFATSAEELTAARYIGGLVFCQIDEAAYITYTENQAATLTDSLNQWDGDLSELLQAPPNNQD
jgi:hypothetical protein